MRLSNERDKDERNTRFCVGSNHGRFVRVGNRDGVAADMSNGVVTSREFEVRISVSPDDDYSLPLSQVSNWSYECELNEVGEDGSITLEVAEGSTPAEAVQRAFTQLGESYFEPSWQELTP